MSVRLNHFFAVFLLSFLGFQLIAFSNTSEDLCVSPYQKTEDPIKQKAFVVLEQKCNFCHVKQKPFYIFTLENMNKFAVEIQTQVFIKKKMPKGKNNHLSTEETATLRQWLDSCLAK